jgi:hypothetical protein
MIAGPVFFKQRLQVVEPDEGVVFETDFANAKNTAQHFGNYE